MDSGLSDEQRLLRETVQRAADAVRADPPRVDDQREDAAGRATLGEMGLYGMRLPEAAGGAGASAFDVVLVAETLAQVPAVAPFAGPMIAAELLRLGAGDGVLAEVGAGALAVTIALDRALASPADAGVAWDSQGATHGVGLRDGAVALGEIAPGGLPCADVTRQAARVTPSASAGGILGEDALARWEAFAMTVLAADLVGVASGALAMAVGYAGERRQFGRPIGSFQALQHLLADAHVSREAARSATYYAAWAVDALEPADALMAARVAKAYAGPAAVEIAEASMQVLGGMGTTWESPAHLYLRRAIFDAQALGGEAGALAAIAGERMGAHDGVR